MVTGVTAGTSTITYRMPAGCEATVVITVNALLVAISGVHNICAGMSETLSDAVTGGSWTSSNR